MAINARKLVDVLRQFLVADDDPAAPKKDDYSQRIIRRKIGEWTKPAIDAMAGDATAELPFGTCDYPATALNIRIRPRAAITANGTNFAVLNVYKRATGGGSQVLLATRSWAATNSVAFAVEELTVAVSALAAGDALTVELTKAAGGLVIPVFHLEVFAEET